MNYVYIFINESIHDYVKVGYTKNIKEALNAINNDNIIPTLYILYAYYEVEDTYDCPVIGESLVTHKVY